MGILKAEEFVGVFLKYLKFYEHEGKARVRGYIPELPEGYEWMIALHCNVKKPTELNSYESIYTNLKNEIPEYKLPDNGNSFDISLYTSKDNIESIYLNIEILSSNKISGGEFFISLTLNEYSRYDSIGGFSLDTFFDSRGFFEW